LSLYSVININYYFVRKRRVIGKAEMRFPRHWRLRSNLPSIVVSKLLLIFAQVEKSKFPD